MSTSPASEHLTAVLQRLAGPHAVPRADQLAAVEAVLKPVARVLVVQATGWGKSAVYWAATTALRKAGGGTTLVISPLLALMRDQLAAAGRAGLARAWYMYAIMYAINAAASQPRVVLARRPTPPWSCR